MKKRDLLRLIESENRKKGYMNEDFYYKSKGGRPSYPGMPEIPEIPEPKRPNWEPEEPNWDPEEPEEPELDEDIDMLRPRNKMSRLSRRMNGPAIIPIRIDPDRKREREREIDPDEWQPDEEEPENPEEGEETKIQGRKNMKFMSEIRNNFNRTMNRLNETHYKPIKYKKY